MDSSASLIARAENGTGVMKDLSKNEWTYKVGIDGIRKGMYKITGHHAAKYKWNTRDIPNKRTFIWYKVLTIYIILICD